ncbi:MAG TPA: caspase family protein [Bryobacteraceae bacterium]
MRTRLVSLIFAAALPLLPASDPILVIDSGGHTGDIRKMIFTKDGRQLISAGDDKVVRVWDIQSGKTVRTILGDIGAGELGKIDAMALSRDDLYLAVGGLLEDGKAPIRIYDFGSGEMKDVLTAAGGTVLNLAFSPDGRYLASVVENGDVEIWDMQARRTPVQKIPKHGDTNTPTAMLAFAPDGAHLARSFGREIAVWPFSAGKASKAPEQSFARRVTSFAFSPDARSLAYSVGDGSIGVFDIAAKSRAPLSSNDGPAWLVFADSKRLLAAPSSRVSAPKILSVPGGSPLANFKGKPSMIYAAAISPDGTLAATAAADTHAISLWPVSSGVVQKELAGVGLPIFKVAFAEDGASIAFGTKFIENAGFNSYSLPERVIRIPDKARHYLGLSPARPDILKYPDPPVASKGYELIPRPSPSGVQLLELMHNGRSVDQYLKDAETGHLHRSVTFTPDAGYFADGADNGYLSMHKSAHTTNPPLVFAGHTGTIWSLSVSPDGNTLASGSDDQTIRLWDLKTAHNLVTFFITRDDEWVAFTPEGYYASSPNGDNYVGWQVNYGRDHAAKYFTVAQFQKEFYRPDVVAAKIERNEAVPASASITGLLPPEIQLITPAESTVTDGMLRLQAVVTSPRPIEQVVLYLNGIPQILNMPAGGDPQKWQVDEQLTLLAGKNTIFLTARDGKSTAKGKPAAATSTVAGGTVGNPRKPDLYVVAVGIKNYTDDSLNTLQYADKDAQDFVKAMHQQEGSRFGHVYHELFVNEQVTKANLEKAIRSMATRGDAQDYKLLFLSGHGAQDAGGYNFLCHDHKEEKIPGGKLFENDMPWQDLLRYLTATSRTILVVDTCHAARASSDVDFDKIMKDTRAEHLSLMTYAASAGTEAAQELRDLGNGVFTKALLDELNNLDEKTLEPDGTIYTDQFGVDIRKRVTALNGDQQHPVSFLLPNGLPPYQLFGRPDKSRKP